MGMDDIRATRRGLYRNHLDVRILESAHQRIMAVLDMGAAGISKRTNREEGVYVVA